MGKRRILMHPWNLTVAEALVLQKNLSQSVIKSGSPGRVERIAGVDMAFRKSGATGYCAIVILSFPGLDVVEEVFINDKVDFPYVPGLLSFREGPLFLKAFETIDKKPDVIIFDGQGIAHPRGIGIASHMGLWLGMSTIGCAKSRLYGTFEEPNTEKNSYTYMYGKDGGVIGAVLRTKKGVKPVYVSTGHLVGLEEAIDIIKHCTGKYRIPEPTRIAHIKAGIYKNRIT